MGLILSLWVLGSGQNLFPPMSTRPTKVGFFFFLRDRLTGRKNIRDGENDYFVVIENSVGYRYIS